MYCNKNYQKKKKKKKKIDENLKKQIFNAYKFSKHDINKFMLLLEKVAYPSEHMDDCEKFGSTLLPEK